MVPKIPEITKRNLGGEIPDIPNKKKKNALVVPVRPSERGLGHPCYPQAKNAGSKKRSTRTPRCTEWRPRKRLHTVWRKEKTLLHGITKRTTENEGGVHAGALNLSPSTPKN